MQSCQTDWWRWHHDNTVHPMQWRVSAKQMEFQHIPWNSIFPTYPLWLWTKDGLVQHCDNCCALVTELPQSCNMPSSLGQDQQYNNILSTVECRYNMPDIVRYYINNYRNCGRIPTRCWIHIRHPTPRPNGRAMGCLLWIFGENWPCYNGTALYFHNTFVQHMNGASHLAGMAGASILVPCHEVKSLQLIWRSGNHSRWNLWLPNLQMSCSDLMEHQDSSPSNDHQVEHQKPSYCYRGWNWIPKRPTGSQRWRESI